MKIGVLGHRGSIGSRHHANLRALGHFVIGYDPLVDRLETRMAVIEHSDSVIIATPSERHLEDIRNCIDAGKHVFAEKPIATRDCDQILDALTNAKTKGLIVFLGVNLRFHPCAIAAKGWIEKGLIGTPKWAHFCCAQATSKKTYKDDGVVLCTGAHEVDLAMHLLGPAKCVSAWAHTDEDPEFLGTMKGTDDMAEFVLEHESGCISSFSLNYIAEDYIREAWIVGEKNIALDLVGRKVSFGKMIQGYPGDWNSDYIDEVAAFVDRCQGKETRGATGADGLAVLEVLLDVRKKAGL